VTARLFILTSLAMIAFASNSLLCRAALKHTTIDAASFTFARIFSGAAMLWIVMKVRGRLRVERMASSLVESRGAAQKFSSTQPSPQRRGGSFSPGEKVRMRAFHLSEAGNWFSAVALFAYAAAFSFAYVSLAAGTGALLLFGAVQATMIFWSFRKGERLHMRQLIGLTMALTGLVILVFPGLSAPPFIGSILMIGAGLAWGIYSLRGQGEKYPASATTGNFLRAVPLTAAVSIILLPWAHLDRAGIGYAALSGAIASGLGYVIWYAALSGLKATGAATVQLSVPVLAATGGILLLGEPITLRYLFASIAVLGGIALVVIEKHQPT
jgi:drug/metabolite transporter (DMT)-like permease